MILKIRNCFEGRLDFAILPYQRDFGRWRSTDKNITKISPSVVGLILFSYEVYEASDHLIDNYHMV